MPKGMICLVVACNHGHGFCLGDKVKIDSIDGVSIKCSLLAGSPLNPLACWFEKDELKPLIQLV